MLSSHGNADFSTPWSTEDAINILALLAGTKDTILKTANLSHHACGAIVSATNSKTAQSITKKEWPFKRLKELV